MKALTAVWAAAVVLVAVTWMAASASAQTKALPAADYIKNVCAALNEVKDAEDAIITTRIDTRGVATFASSQQEGLDVVTEYQRAWVKAAATLETISPQVSDGAKIGALFADYATTGTDTLQRIIDTYRAADPASRTYMARLTNFVVNASNMRLQVANPLMMVTDRAVRAAFDDEKLCADLFPKIVEGGPVDPAVQVTEFRTPTADATPFAITMGPDGNVWFTEIAVNQIGKLDPATGRVTEFPVPTPNARPNNIAVGPDGNIWFTEQIGRQIGKINPATGVITEIPIPNATPGNITAGPDGNLWFTESGAGPPGKSFGPNTIGKIDPATGVATVFPIPTANFKPRRIAFGPDGHLWFTGEIADRVGRIDPSTGVITEVMVPSVRRGSHGLAMGVDGNVWITSVGGNQVRRIDPRTRSVTEFPAPSPESAPFAIVQSCDGYLWFTEETGNNIGRIDPATGLITEYPVPTSAAEPFGIAAAPDGNIWFTEQGGHKIGKVDLSAVRKKDERTFKDCRSPLRP